MTTENNWQEVLTEEEREAYARFDSTGLVFKKSRTTIQNIIERLATEVCRLSPKKLTEKDVAAIEELRSHFDFEEVPEAWQVTLRGLQKQVGYLKDQLQEQEELHIKSTTEKIRAEVRKRRLLKERIKELEAEIEQEEAGTDTSQFNWRIE